MPWPRPSETGADQRLEQLRATIRSIERRPAALVAADGGAAAGTREPETAWTLGEPGIDARLGVSGLEAGAVHEIKPAEPGPPGAGSDWATGCAAARRFALGLAVRRLAMAPAALQTAPLLLCASAARSADLGRPYGPGLAALGIDPGRLIIVEPAKAGDVLWAIEEGLKSAGLALVLGEIDDVALTPARRLALAAARTGTPGLLLTHPRGGAMAATATRWRIWPAPSGPHSLDPEAPGAVRLRIELERCRGSPAAARAGPSLLEWCDAAYCFRMASGVADRAPGARLPAGGPRRIVGEARCA